MRNADIVEDDELTDWNFHHDAGIETLLDSSGLKKWVEDHR